MDTKIPTFTRLSELRDAVATSSKLFIKFEDGAYYNKRLYDGKLDYSRDHDTKFMFDTYSNEERFVQSIWRRIRNGRIISEYKSIS